MAFGRSNLGAACVAVDTVRHTSQQLGYVRVADPVHFLRPTNRAAVGNASCHTGQDGHAHPGNTPYWQPLPAAECQDLADAISATLRVAATVMTTTFFTDALAGPTGTGCRIAAVANNQLLNTDNALSLLDRLDPPCSNSGDGL